MSAKRRHALAVTFAPIALSELDAVWNWNEKTYSREHAAAYIDFLLRQIDGIARRHSRGRAVAGRPGLSYVLIRRRSQGHGHVVVYRVNAETLHVLHIFHSAQDWQSALTENRPEA